MKLLLACCLVAVISHVSAEEIQRLWLTHQTDHPSKIVVNWQTSTPGDSVVEYGSSAALGEQTKVEGQTTLHHVEIPAGDGKELHYRVRSGADVSGTFAIRRPTDGEFRVAVVADTGFPKKGWSEAILGAKPDLLISAGDHVPALHSGGQATAVNDVTAFAKLVASAPELFRTTPWMPLLGNHDREVRPRGPKPPSEPVYDVEATAFREFFALPGEEWKWFFDLPAFGARFVALDLSHLSDQGTTWQTCQSPKREEAQFGWYRDLVVASRQPFLITLYNERNSTVRGLEGGEWGRMIGRGSLAITGFGYFAERAEVDGVPYYNTSISGTGAPYKDPKSAFFKSEDNFLLLTFRKSPAELRVEVKNLQGETLDSKTFSPRVGLTPP